jgi:hypothetical protein
VARLAADIGKVKNSIAQIEKHQSASRRGTNLLSQATTAESTGVLRIGKAIAAGIRVNLGASDSKHRAGIDKSLRLSRQKIGEAGIGKLGEWLASGTKAAESLRVASTQRAIEAGVGRGMSIVRDRTSRAEYQTGRATDGFSNRQSLLEAAAAIAARPNAGAAPAMKQVEFAEPARTQRSRNLSDSSASISIQSSPTVIIHSSENQGDLERQVAGALRRHREELFDELRQEAARRERAEY